MNKDLMFSSATCEWATPPELFKALDAEFGFTCDVCATADNAKCKEFYPPEQDGLAQVLNEVDKQVNTEPDTDPETGEIV